MANAAAQRLGAAWFGHNPEAGICHCCQRASRVYRGYNGGQFMGVTMCGHCQAPGHDVCNPRPVKPT